VTADFDLTEIEADLRLLADLTPAERKICAEYRRISAHLRLASVVTKLIREVHELRGTEQM
jgi:hypothetical protein